MSRPVLKRRAPLGLIGGSVRVTGFETELVSARVTVTVTVTAPASKSESVDHPTTSIPLPPGPYRTTAASLLHDSLGPIA